jgi:EmrB/QacA subfamily drug resistance transporter
MAAVRRVEGSRQRGGAADAISPRAWRVLVLGSLCSFITALNLSIMNVAFPDLRRSFPEASSAELSWVLNGYTIVSGATLILAAVVSDRLGRKRVLLAGLAVFTVAGVACAMAPNPTVLITARVVQALGAALITPATVQMILADVPVSRRGTAVAAWSAIGGIATALGPSLGAVVVDVGTWRWAFWISLPIGLLVFTLGLWYFTEAEPHELVRGPLPDPLGAVALAAGVMLVILGLVQSPTWGWGDQRTLACLVGGALGIGVLVWRSARVRNPMIDLDLLRYRNLRLAAALSIGYGLGFFAMSLGLVLFLTQVWGYSVVRAGVLVAPVAVMVTVLSPSAGRLADRLGHRVIAVPGGLAWAAGSAWLLTRAGGEPDLAGVWFPAVLLLGIGSAMAWPTIHGIPMVGLPQSRFGAATATNQTVLRLSTALGVGAAITLISGEEGGGVEPFRRLFVLMLLSGLVLAAVGSRIRTAPGDAPLADLDEVRRRPL